MAAKIALAVLALSLLGSAATAQAPAGPRMPGEPPAGAQGQALVEHGNAAYQYYCAPCHGAGKGLNNAPALPGTHALNIKYRGERPGLLEQRDDLTADYVRFIARNGIEGMPSFRRVELSDANLNAIGAYLGKGK